MENSCRLLPLLLWRRRNMKRMCFWNALWLLSSVCSGTLFGVTYIYAILQVGGERGEKAESRGAWQVEKQAALLSRHAPHPHHHQSIYLLSHLHFPSHWFFSPLLSPWCITQQKTHAANSHYPFKVVARVSHAAFFHSGSNLKMEIRLKKGRGTVGGMRNGYVGDARAAPP